MTGWKTEFINRFNQIFNNFISLVRSSACCVAFDEFVENQFDGKSSQTHFQPIRIITHKIPDQNSKKCPQISITHNGHQFEKFGFGICPPGNNFENNFGIPKLNLPVNGIDKFGQNFPAKKEVKKFST